MGNKARIGHGTKLQFGDKADFNDTPIAYTSLIGVESVNPVSPEVDDIDVTDMDSLERWREFKPGLKDGGEVEATIQYEEAQNTTLQVTLLAVTRAWKVLFPDGSFVEFNGHINGIDHEDPMDDKIMQTLTIKVTGKPVFTEVP